MLKDKSFLIKDFPIVLNRLLLKEIQDKIELMMFVVHLMIHV
jgi:hypothetical protein